ncbi:type II secretion system GspH family protein [Patescibacteria group bacterium]|nr:type II secretion system GspH family protein [Patescibacteria group bacterium]
MKSTNNKNLSEKIGGFTLIELVIYIGIFIIVSLFFVDILLSVTSIQSRQNAASIVDQESQFLLQQIQTQVEQSSIIDIAVNTPTSTLLLRMPSSSIDAVFIYASSTSVYLQQCPNYLQQSCLAPTALTSNRVNVSGLTFTRKQNPNSRDLVSVSFTMAYNGNNPQQIYASSFDSAIARVNAATFDTSLLPSGANQTLGTNYNQYWQSINGAIYFLWNGTNPLIGIGTANPGQTLEINGGIRLNTSSALPACNSTQRGTIWVAQGGAGKDTLEACLQNSSGTLGWQILY